MEEFYTFLDTVHAYRYVPEAVSEIVMEEVSTFLRTGKTPESCADVIQSRVSIYLSENDWRRMIHTPTSFRISCNESKTGSVSP